MTTRAAGAGRRFRGNFCDGCSALILNGFPNLEIRHILTMTDQFRLFGGLEGRRTWSLGFWNREDHELRGDSETHSQHKTCAATGFYQKVATESQVHHKKSDGGVRATERLELADH